jgi:hypothetical protein
VPEGASAAAEQGGPAFPEGAQRALDGVASAVLISSPARQRLPDRNVDAAALIAGIGGWAGQPRPVEGGQGVQARGGDVVHRAGLGLRDPSGNPLAASTAWTLPP